MARASIKTVVAEALGISRKNIYRKSKQEEKDNELRIRIEEAYKEHPAYGQYKMSLELGINHKRAERVMKKFGLRAPRRKRKRYFCTVPSKECTYTNQIKHITKDTYIPNMIWVSDITYIKYRGSFWYLGTIEDIATRQILSCQIGKHHNADLIMKLIKQAVSNTKTSPEYYHCDRGTENMAEMVTNYLEGMGTKISVSDKGSPWQNGYKESFFGRFKEEFGEIDRYDSIEELIEGIYSQIYYYNFKRIHRSLKMPPVAYAELNFLDSCLQKRGT